MEYLVYVRPPTEFFEVARYYRSIILNYLERQPSMEEHCTVIYDSLNEKKENKILKKIGKTTFNPFNLYLGDFDLFSNNSLVLRIKESADLSNLQEKITASLRDYVDLGKTNILREDTENAYNPDSYNPHITICGINPKDFHKIKEFENPFQNYKFEVNEIILSKMQNNIWNTVRRFNY